MEESVILKLGLTRSQLVECLEHCTRADICEHCCVSPRTLDRIIYEYQLTRPNYGPKRLSKSMVKTIRELYAQGSYTQTQLAEKFEISQALVCKIVNRCVHRDTGSLVFQGEAKTRMAYGNQG